MGHGHGQRPWQPHGATDRGGHWKRNGNRALERSQPSHGNEPGVEPPRTPDNARGPCNQVLELLLQNITRSSGGVDIGDQHGKSALMLAVEAGRANCVEQLITRGANISCADHAQQTPMAVAERGHEAILEMMLAYKLAQDEKLLRQIDVE